MAEKKFTDCRWCRKTIRRYGQRWGILIGMNVFDCTKAPVGRDGKQHHEPAHGLID